MKTLRPTIIAVDFDGTLVVNEFPRIGKDLGAMFYLQQLKYHGCELILWTSRAGPPLEEAADWLEERGYLELFHTVNVKAPSCTFPDDPRKVYADIYVDDRGLGAPMKTVKHEDGGTVRHFDWGMAGPALLKAAGVKGL